MAELFDEVDEQLDLDAEELLHDNFETSSVEARRRLERLLAEKKLRNELDDSFEDY
jgi:hypothetical protein